MLQRSQLECGWEETIHSVNYRLLDFEVANFRLKLACSGLEELVSGKKMEVEDRLLFWNGIVDWKEAELGQNFHTNWKEEKKRWGTTFGVEVDSSYQESGVVDRKKPTDQVEDQVSLLVTNMETCRNGHIMPKSTTWSRTVVQASQVARFQQGHTADDATTSGES